MAGTWPLVGRDEELALVGAALRDRSTRCLLLSGSAGVGKTRLAREVATSLQRDGWRARWVIGTEQSGSIPLGAMAPLLAGRPAESARSDRDRLLDWAWRQMVAHRPARDIVVVDDAPLLDQLTAALVARMVRTGAPTRLLLTARGEQMPEWIADLVVERQLEHIRIQPLGEGDVARLLERVLDGVADASTHAVLWAHCGGNPLWLRQLVEHGVDGGALRRRDDIYRWDGPIQAGDLHQLLADRLSAIPASQGRALELAALAEPLPVAAARELGIEADLAALLDRELIEQDATGRLRIAHPMYGSVARGRLSTLARRAAERRLADAFLVSGPLTGQDVLRVAQWRLDAGDAARPGDATLMVDAAGRALTVDSALAERLARAAAAIDPGYPSLHVLGRALFDQRRIAEAEQVCHRLLDHPLSAQERLGVRLELAMIRASWRGDADGAIADLRAAETEFTPYGALIAGMRASVELFRGDPAAALATSLPIATDPAFDMRIRFLASLEAVPALAMLGRVDRALDLARWARRAAPEQDFSGPLPPGPTFAAAHLEWGYAFALRWAGRIDEAIDAAGTSLRRSAVTARHHTQSYGLLNAAAGGALLAAGDVRHARGPLRAGASALRDSDTYGSVVSCLADLARVEALGDNVAAARALVAEAAERCTPATGVFDAALCRARSVVAAMAGDRAGAREHARAGARRAAETGQAVLEAACLHLLVRWGDPAAACARLAEIAEGTDADLVAIFAAHADAEARGDAPALERVAERFGAAGARMLAAGAAASAARAHRRAGRAMGANRAAQLCRDFSARCPGAPLPRLQVEPVPLTARERDVVEMARRGSSNQEIAEAFALSVRTVESHLQHVYRKLGIRGRSELVEAPAGPR